MFIRSFISYLYSLVQTNKQTNKQTKKKNNNLFNAESENNLQGTLPSPVLFEFARGKYRLSAFPSRQTHVDLENGSKQIRILKVKYCIVNNGQKPNKIRTKGERKHFTVSLIPVAVFHYFRFTHFR